MSNEYTEEHLLKQVDDLLERGKASDYAVLNDLAGMIPQADKDFQHQLEARLVAKLQRSVKEEEVSMETITAQAPRRAPTVSFFTWAAAVVVIVTLGGLGLKFSQSNSPDTDQNIMPLLTQPVPTDDNRPRTIVVAMQYIVEGDYLSEPMIDTITVSPDVFAKLQYRYPGETIYSDISQVTGKQASASMDPLEPFVSSKLGIKAESCASDDPNCIPVPENYSEINLPPPSFALPGGYDIQIGDRVDVMFDMNNQYMSVENVLITRIANDYLTVAAPGWKRGLLTWYSRLKNQSYTVREYKENKPVGWDDQTPVEYTLRTLTYLSNTNKFQMYVQIPLSQVVHTMSQIPTMDLAQTTISRDTVWISFPNVELVRTLNESTYVVRMPKGDAANLDHLLMFGADLTIWQEAPGRGTPMPTALPTNTAPENTPIPINPPVPLPPGRVGIPLSSKDPLPEGDQFDVFMSLPSSDVSVLAGLPVGASSVPFHNNNGILEFEFLNLLVIGIYPPGSFDWVSDQTMLSFHGSPEDAALIEYLDSKGAQVRFVAKTDESFAQIPDSATSTPVASSTPLPTFTWTPTPESETSSATEEPCTLAVCRFRVPAEYYEIKLPVAEITMPQPLSEGDRVDLLRTGSTDYGLKIENVLLVSLREDTITIAAPAWQYSLLLWFSESGVASSYTMLSSDGVDDVKVYEPMTPTTYTIETADLRLGDLGLEILPETFQLVFQIPETEGYLLKDLPYNGLRSSLQDGVLWFWFSDLETVSSEANEDSVIRLPAGQAANLDYLRSLGIKMDVGVAREDLPIMPTWTADQITEWMLSATPTLPAIPSPTWTATPVSQRP